jgi:hypothetical protein
MLRRICPIADEATRTANDRVVSLAHN